jgi:hypothetical protein
MRRSTWIGIALLVVAAVAGLLVAPRILLAGWLAAWWWTLGLVLGCFSNAWMFRLTGGRWGEPLAAAALLLSRTVPWLLLALVPIAVGYARLYPWADPSGAWLHIFKRPEFPRVWLSAPFFIARLVVYAIAWWVLTRPSWLARKDRAAAGLLLYGVLTSLAGVDLIMSLVPGWYSTAFGLVVLSVQALSGAAIAVLFSHADPGALTRTGVEDTVPVSRDLGNLLLTWVMSWAYLAFMQFLIIWAENLPREVSWYAPRLQTGWAKIAVLLVLVQLVLPFLALLFRGVKDHPHRLMAVAALLLFATALDATWMVLPSVDAHTLHGWWLFPVLFAGAALLVFAPAPRRPLTKPSELRHVQ